LYNNIKHGICKSYLYVLTFACLCVTVYVYAGITEDCGEVSNYWTSSCRSARGILTLEY